MVPTALQLRDRDFCLTTAMSTDRTFKNLVLDLSGVLVKWDRAGASGMRDLINPGLFSNMIEDSIWSQYEAGTLTTEEVYGRLSQKFGVPEENIRGAVKIAMEGLTPVPEIVEIVNEFHGKLRLFCMTNVPSQQLEYVCNKFPEILQKMERIYASAEVGLLKPNSEFFCHVLGDAGINPAETVFVDDTFQNCVVARSLGITSVFCESVDSAVRQLNCLLRGEKQLIARAQRYFNRVLEHDRQDLYTVSNKGTTLSDNLSEFFIFELLDDMRFCPVLRIPENGELCYTRDTDMGRWTFYPLPNDLSTTAVGMSVLYAHNKVSLKLINSVVDNMLKYASEDGILQTYFDHSRRRVCHVGLANIAMLFHVAGRRLPQPCVDFLHNVLENKAYLEGSQYYIGPASFLFCLSRTAAKFRENHFLTSDFIPLLTARVREVMATQSDPLAIAMVILAGLNLDIDPDIRDLERLAVAQNNDGSWNLSYWLKANIHMLGGKALTSAFALSALQRARSRFEQLTSVPTNT